MIYGDESVSDVGLQFEEDGDTTLLARNKKTLDHTPHGGVIDCHTV